MQMPYHYQQQFLRNYIPIKQSSMYYTITLNNLQPVISPGKIWSISIYLPPQKSKKM